ncbi:MAG TPA: hypothetical protein VGK30_11370 [Candidatus Binatia bacterium]|jgi:predicted ribosomally synthesized peptide with SipW-like signal peptide
MRDPRDRPLDDASRSASALAVLLLIAGAGTLAYWTAFFTSDLVQATVEPCYLVFERTFPAADAWAAVTAILCALGLLRRRPEAVLFGVAAGSAFTFLGLMDVLYNLEHGMYAVHTPEMAYETLINVVCLTLGPATMACVWRWRRRLDPAVVR